MERARDEFLAGARLAADEHGDRLGGDAADLFQDRLNSPALAPNVPLQARGFGHGKRLGGLRGRRLSGRQRQGRRLMNGFNELVHFLRCAGLGNVVVSPAARCANRGIGCGISRHQNDGKSGLAAVQLVDDFEALGFTAFAPGNDPMHIGNHHVEVFPLGLTQPGVGVGRDLHVIPLAPQGGLTSGCHLVEEPEGPAVGAFDARSVQVGSYGLARGLGASRIVASPRQDQLAGGCPAPKELRATPLNAEDRVVLELDSQHRIVGGARSPVAIGTAP